MHLPVLKKEVVDYLDLKPNDNFIDCTIGLGGHSLEILKRIGPNGKVLGIDWDKSLVGKLEYGGRVILVQDNFANLKKIVEEKKFFRVKGILLDLGMSSWDLDESGRGFSFFKDEPLDMRYFTGMTNDQTPLAKLTAADIVNSYSEEELEGILREYGEEKFSRQMAKKITEQRRLRPIERTVELVEIIRQAVPISYSHQRIHFATRTFQALRIAVNNELENLREVLPQAVDILETGGRLVVISFQSLEDRIVKNFFKNETFRIKIITKKPITVSQEELKLNPRARSAKLRVGEKINE